MTRARGLALAGVAAAAGVARADPPPSEPAPDPAVAAAGEANLESTAPRRGIMVTLATGGAVSVGLGMKNATAQGGAATLRLGQVATPRTVIGIELVLAALFFDVEPGDGGSLYRTDAGNLLVSAQYYVNPALWIRGAVGVGRYSGDERIIDDLIVRRRIRLLGPSGSVGAGIDVVRLKRFRASFEVSSTAMVNRDGVLSSNALLLGLTVD